MSKSPSPTQLHALLAALIKEAPAFNNDGTLSEYEQKWLGRAHALLVEIGQPFVIPFQMARSKLGTIMENRAEVLQPLHDAFYRIELLVPEESRGTFIPAGETWNGYAAIIKLIQTAKHNLLVVDPYLNSTIFTEFAPHSLIQMKSRFLTTKRPENDAGLQASSTKWASDEISQRHPVEVKYAPSGTLHDRLIIIDDKEVWLISQSFKDIAKRSPATVSKVDGEMSAMKTDHYERLWLDSTPIL